MSHTSLLEKLLEPKVTLLLFKFGCFWSLVVMHHTTRIACPRIIIIINWVAIVLPALSVWRFRPEEIAFHSIRRSYSISSQKRPFTCSVILVYSGKYEPNVNLRRMSSDPRTDVENTERTWTDVEECRARTKIVPCLPDIELLQNPIFSPRQYNLLLFYNMFCAL